jgi:murein peptide amidase A
LTRLLTLLLATLPVGHSVDGRAIAPVILGTPNAAHRVLVIGCIHGNETAGIAVVRKLIDAGAPSDTEIVALTSVNPDGCARGTRQNAHGVDLNRNFPSNWTRIGARGSFQWSGPRPLSEPESRYVVALVEKLRPQVTIWFHQHEGFVRAWGESIPTARRFAQLAEYPYRSVRWPFGTAANWQNHRFPGTASFVVELPAGPVPAARIPVWVRAIRQIATQGYVP